MTQFNIQYQRLAYVDLVSWNAQT